MPVVIVSNVEHNNPNDYYISLHDICNIFPHIDEDKEMDVYIVEIRNERGKIIKRFKPFRKISLKIGKHYNNLYGWTKHLRLSENIVTQLNIGKDYKLIIILTRYDGKPFLPFEIKTIGYEAQKVFEYFSKIEANLLLLNLELSPLNKAISYLWDAYFRLEENDVEGARTALRNSLEVLKKDLVPRLIISERSEESKDFPQRLNKLFTNIQGFLHYGGPHPGPAPRTTTEMILSLTMELIRYLAKSIINGIICFQEVEK